MPLWIFGAALLQSNNGLIGFLPQEVTHLKATLAKLDLSKNAVHIDPSLLGQLSNLCKCNHV